MKEMAMDIAGNQSVLADFEHQIETLWQSFGQLNQEKSFKKTFDLLQTSFTPVEEKLNLGDYLVKGGYSAFNKDLKEWTKSFNSATKGIEMGTRKTEAEMDFWEKKIRPAQEMIMQSDEKLSEAERKQEEEKVQKPACAKNHMTQLISWLFNF